jgi:hypothetical protein
MVSIAATNPDGSVQPPADGASGYQPDGQLTTSRWFSCNFWPRWNNRSYQPMVPSGYQLMEQLQPGRWCNLASLDGTTGFQPRRYSYSYQLTI